MGIPRNYERRIAKAIKAMLLRGETWSEIAESLNLPEKIVRNIAKRYLYKK